MSTSTTLSLLSAPTANPQLLDDLLLLAVTDPDVLAELDSPPAADPAPAQRSGRKTRKAPLIEREAPRMGASSGGEVRQILARLATRCAELALFGELEPVREDYLLLAHLTQALVDDDGALPVQHLAALFGQDGRITLAISKRIRQLVKQSVLLVRRRESGPGGEELSLLNVLQSQVRLSSRVAERIFQESGEADAEDPPTEPQDPLDEAFHLLRPLRRNGPGGSSRRVSQLATFGRQWTELVRRNQERGVAFPLAELVGEAELDAAETAVLLYLVEDTCNGQICTDTELTGFAGGTGLQRLTNPLFGPNSRLLKAGHVTMEEGGFGPMRVTLSPAALGRLTGRPQPSGLQALESFLANQSLLSLAEPGAEWERVVLPASVGHKLDQLVKGLTKQESLAAWGRGVDGRSRGRCLLFSGPSGTGKTHTALALARRLDLPVLVTDSSRIIDSLVGESQKHVVQLFRTYREACKVLGRAPLLLLDEADQLLGTRAKVEHSVDRMYNALQNLFLQELERFEGLLVATTNLPELMDSAFKRRFYARITIDRPGQAERRLLWDLHLPEEMPRLEPLDLDRLACLDLSGGQIALAARQAVEIAALRGDGMRQRDLDEAVEYELNGVATGTVARPMGFGRG